MPKHSRVRRYLRSCVPSCPETLAFCPRAASLSSRLQAGSNGAASTRRRFSAYSTSSLSHCPARSAPGGAVGSGVGRRWRSVSECVFLRHSRTSFKRILIVRKLAEVTSFFCSFFFSVVSPFFFPFFFVRSYLLDSS
jgi:hypothetical protein